MTDLNPECSPTTNDEFGAQTAKSRYSVLANQKLEALWMDNMSAYEEALENYLAEKGQVPFLSYTDKLKEP